jgi:lysophospholipase L1-like esterase
MIARMVSPLRYVALGSSFAAGPGIEPIVDTVAMRSGNNYPHLLAKALNAELTDLTVSGATTATILDERQVTMLGAELAPQLDGVPGSADLVTVTAGGNDLRYMASMMFTAWHRTDPAGPVTEMLAAEFTGIPAPSAHDVDRTAAGLAEIVTRVRSRAPGARVLLVDYLTIFGADAAPGPGIPFEPAELDAFRAVQTALEAAYVAAADRSGAGLVAVSAGSRDHGLGSARPWIAPFSTDLTTTFGSLHPNAAGMAAVADAVVKQLGA